MWVQEYTLERNRKTNTNTKTVIMETDPETRDAHKENQKLVKGQKTKKKNWKKSKTN